MGIKEIHILFLLLLHNSVIQLIHGQDNNQSYIATFWFSQCHNEIFGLTATSDGGFAFIKGVGAKKIEDNHKFIEVCCNCKATEVKNVGGAVLHKADKYGRVEWAKYLGKWKSAKVIQTRDKGYCCSLGGRILKTDSLGNIVWDIDFETDTIPHIKKSKFLSESGASDITECSDGSFIALLSASFSLLKISKDGKPLWLKSTVFEEFSPMIREYNIDVKKHWGNNPDTIGINPFVYNRGGGVYIQTYNIYETEDGGYMAIGKNNYRYKGFITDYSDSNKVYITTRDLPNGGFERYEVPRPEKIYLIRKYALKDSNDIKKFRKQGTTVVVKTDSLGNVLWERQFGDYSWGASMSSSSGSDLIKLAGGKYLVRIRDCIKAGKHYDGQIKWGGCGSKFFKIDENGNEIWGNEKLNAFECDPDKLILAADSGFYASEGTIITKYDKNFKLLWSRGNDITGKLWSQPVLAATSDSGVVCDGGGGYIVKFDKHGSIPSQKINIETRVNRQDNGKYTLEMSFITDGVMPGYPSAFGFDIYGYCFSKPGEIGRAHV